MASAGDVEPSGSETFPWWIIAAAAGACCVIFVAVVLLARSRSRDALTSSTGDDDDVALNDIADSAGAEEGEEETPKEDFILQIHASTEFLA
jgi:hypothetical protein